MYFELQTAVERIQKSKEPVTLVGDLIVAEGGFWDLNKASDPTSLFTIQLMGIQGFGMGASAAIDKWLERAQEVLKSERFFDKI